MAEFFFETLPVTPEGRCFGALGGKFSSSVARRPVGSAVLLLGDCDWLFVRTLTGWALKAIPVCPDFWRTGLHEIFFMEAKLLISQ